MIILIDGGNTNYGTVDFLAFSKPCNYPVYLCVLFFSVLNIFVLLYIPTTINNICSELLFIILKTFRSFIKPVCAVKKAKAEIKAFYDFVFAFWLATTRFMCCMKKSKVSKIYLYVFLLRLLKYYNTEITMIARSWTPTTLYHWPAANF